MNKQQFRTQLIRLLRNHHYVGARPEPLLEVLRACRFGYQEPGSALCREGEGGETLYFLMSGSLKVTRRDRRGVEQDLATMRAPALVGHMSLIDRSPRSATCTIAERAFVGTLDQRDCNRFLDDTGPAGTAFRRLLLASLQQQQSSGIGRLRDLLNQDEAGDESEAEAVQALEVTTAVLGGWSPDNVDSGSWMRQAFDQAHELPLEDGARLVINMESDEPFLLELHRFAPDQARRTAARFIRFLTTIPTPPKARVRFHSCPSDLLARPQIFNQRMRLFFPKNSFVIAGTEQEIEITFTNPDQRWTASEA